MANRDPDTALTVGGVIVGFSVALAGATALVALSLEERAAALARPRRREPARGRALRRGIGIGALVGVLALLRAADGLTVVTGGFVVAGFLLAELVLGARPVSRSG